MDQILTSFRHDQVRTISNLVDLSEMSQEWVPDLIICERMVLPSKNMELHHYIRNIPTLQNIPLILTIPSSFGLTPVRLHRFRDVSGYLIHPFAVSDLLAAHDAILQGETYYHGEETL
jgi:hypothetical protein